MEQKMQSIWDSLLRWFYTIRSLLEKIYTLILRFMNNASSSSTVIVLDSGKRVRIGRQIGEGGFSIILEAYDADTIQKHHQKHAKQQQQMRYALKRIRCPDEETVELCRKEATVHRILGNENPNLMPLLGVSITTDKHYNTTNNNQICYMLFPYIQHSLRHEMNQRIPSLVLGGRITKTDLCPWSSEVVLLQLFYQLCCAVQYMHDHNYTHRDIKLENILLSVDEGTTAYVPVLMDFGSAGSITESIATRRDVLQLIDTASSHTTISYRPPELFDGGIRPPSLNNHNANKKNTAATTNKDDSNTSNNNDGTVFNYRCVDVWGLGCTLHAMMYGVSPCECEFARSDGTIQIMEVSHLSVLRGIPIPPKHSVVATWYSTDLYTTLLEPMLQQDYQKRIPLPLVIASIEKLIYQKGGTIPIIISPSNNNKNNQRPKHHFGDDYV